eukprot:2835141-Rhodomonas_salina.2
MFNLDRLYAIYMAIDYGSPSNHLFSNGPDVMRIVFDRCKKQIKHALDPEDLEMYVEQGIVCCSRGWSRGWRSIAPPTASRQRQRQCNCHLKQSFGRAMRARGMRGWRHMARGVSSNVEALMPLPCGLRTSTAREAEEGRVERVHAEAAVEMQSLRRVRSEHAEICERGREVLGASRCRTPRVGEVRLGALRAGAGPGRE